MATYRISKTFCWQGTITDKVALVCRIFGLTADRLTQRRLTYNCQLQINDGDIVYFTGPSGAGKSVLLGELQKSIPASQRVSLARIKLPGDKTLVDCFDGDVLSGLRLLSTAGLNDCLCILNQPDKRSAGQKYRFRLATALAAHKKFIFADEFCSELDRITAAVISHNLHRFAKQTGTTFILASSHQDILLDLEPDVLVTLELCGPVQVIHKHRNR